jgi:transposase
VVVPKENAGGGSVIKKEQEAQILRLHYAEKWRVGTIAKELGVHRSAVQRVLSNNGVSLEQLRVRKFKADPYIAFIKATLKQYPQLTAVRLYQMVKERGFTGGASQFRHVVSQLRPRQQAEAYMRTATLPGEQGQCDWAHFGKATFGDVQRRLLAFVIVLSWSRHIFLRFYTGDAMPNFLRGHVEAFEYFGAVPREILYDNLKSAVLERYGSAIRFNPELLNLAAHYRFQPKPVAVARGNQKGRVERAIQYIRHSFFAARQWTDLVDLNNQATSWCMHTAGQRQCPGEKDMTVAEAFEKEKPLLLKLPDAPYPAFERKQVHVGKTPYVRFDLNDYSVPHKFVKQTLTVVATPDTVSVIDGTQEIAQHKRCYGKGCQIEEPKHVEELALYKEAGRKHRYIDRLRHAAPSAQCLLKEAAQRGHNLGKLTQQLTRLLDMYGASELEAAIVEAIEATSPHAHAVQQILECRRNLRGLPPPALLTFTNRQINELVLAPQSLDVYGSLLQKQEKQDNE